MLVVDSKRQMLVRGTGGLSDVSVMSSDTQRWLAWIWGVAC